MKKELEMIRTRLEIITYLLIIIIFILGVVGLNFLVFGVI